MKHGYLHCFIKNAFENRIIHFLCSFSHSQTPVSCNTSDSFWWFNASNIHMSHHMTLREKIL